MGYMLYVLLFKCIIKLQLVAGHPMIAGAMAGLQIHWENGRGGETGKCIA